MVTVTHQQLYTPVKRQDTQIVQQAGLALGPVWMGAGNLAPPPPEFDLRAVQPVTLRNSPFCTSHFILRILIKF
jgi:hypothetical protein